MAVARKRTRDLFLKEFSAALAQDTAAMFVGAGVSIAAGYPSWKDLLRDIGAELACKSLPVRPRAQMQGRVDLDQGWRRYFEVLGQPSGPNTQ